MALEHDEIMLDDDPSEEGEDLQAQQAAQQAPVRWDGHLANKVWDAYQAFQCNPLARVSVDEVLKLLSDGRHILAQGPEGPDAHAVLACATTLSYVLQGTLNNVNTITRFDVQSSNSPVRLLQVTVEYTFFYLAVLDALVRREELPLNNNNVDNWALSNSTGFIHALTNNNNANIDLWHVFLTPTRLRDYLGIKTFADHLMNRAAFNRPGEDALPDLGNLPVSSGCVFIAALLLKCGAFESLAKIVDLLPPAHLASWNTVLGFIQELDISVVRDEREAGPESPTHGHVQKLEEALQRACARFQAQIEEDPEPLAERERAFTGLSRVFESMFQSRVLLSDGSPAAQVAIDQEVTTMQRVFILRMLRSTNFNNLLSAARECHRMLIRAEQLIGQGANALQDADVWLKEHNVIHTLLKANLHQRQYADLVLSILQVLTRYGLIRTEHLDMLWAATEAEGTFDVVKANVYAMIQDLAAGLDESLMNQLFNKFEVSAQGRSVADSVRLLDLLKKLATSNTAKPSGPEGKNLTAERLLALIWKLTMPADAPPELLACDAMTDVLRQYGGIGHWLYCKHYLNLCCQELERRQNVYTALRILKQLLTLFEALDNEQHSRDTMEGAPNQDRALHSVLSELESSYGLQRLLVDNLKALMSEARAVSQNQIQTLQGRASISSVAAQQTPLKTRPSVNASGASFGQLGYSSEAGGALRLPGQGHHSYGTILSEYLAMITYVASKQQSYYSEERALSLWDALVLNPVQPSDRDLGYKFVQDGVTSQHGEFLSHSTKTALLESRITQLSPEDMTGSAWDVYQLYFYKVNFEAKTLMEEPTDPTVNPEALLGTRAATQMKVKSLDKLHGSGFMLQVALNCNRAEVAHKAADLLMQVYIRGTQGTELEAQGMSEFTTLCLSHCMKAASSLAGLGAMETWQDALRSAHTAGIVKAEMKREGDAEMGADPAAEAAVRTVQRCLLLLSLAAETGQPATMPLVSSHQSSFQTIPWDIECSVQSRRFKLNVGPNEYVGTLRRMIAAELQQEEPQRLRLIHGGTEWRNDARTLRQVLQRIEVQRQMQVMVMINAVANSYTQPTPEYVQRWKHTVLAQLTEQPDLYEMLLYMSDQPQWKEVCKQAMRLLQVLPTCPWVTTALRTALARPPEQACSELRALLLPAVAAGSTAAESEAVAPVSVTPSQMTYWLQALHALLFPTKSLLSDFAPELAAAAGPSAPVAAAPADTAARTATLLRSMSGCIPVLQDVIACAGQMIEGEGLFQRLPSVMELHTQMVQLLANLSKRDALLDMTQPQPDSSGAVAASAGSGGGRTGPLAASRPLPVPLDLLLTSPGNSPSLSGTTGGVVTSLGTPTGALQALSMAATESEAEGQQPAAAGTAQGVVSPGAVPAAEAQSRLQHSSAVAAAPQQTPPPPDLELPDAAAPTAPSPAPAAAGDAGDAMVVAADGDAGSVPASAGADSVGDPGGTGTGAIITSTDAAAKGMVSLLVRTCWQATHAATLAAQAAAAVSSDEPTALSQQAEAALAEAVAVVRDGLGTLQRLLNGCPALFDTFLADPASPHLVSGVLLNEHSAALRMTCSEALRKTCLPLMNSGLSCMYEWLLRQLVQCRPQALRVCNGASKEYFELLSAIVDCLPAMHSISAKMAPQLAPQDLASQLLQEEMAALHALMAWQDSAGEEPAGHSSGAIGRDLSTSEGQEELQGRLQLIRKLVNVLGKAADGDTTQQDLIKLLINKYLFPEAWLFYNVNVNTADAQTASPRDLLKIHTACATSTAARSAAFELLAELMAGCSQNMQCGSEVLGLLHCRYMIPPRLNEKKHDPIEPLRQPGSFCGLKNGGATCYMNSVIQQLFMQPRVRALMLGARPVPREEQADSLFAQLQLLMANLAFSCAGSIKPDAFWRSVKDYDNMPIDIREHQDAYEFFTRLQDSVDSHLRGTGQVPALASVFGGKFVQQIISREGPHRSEREEEFYQISVDVKGKGNLQSSLASYVQGELMEGENAWHCEALGRKVAATRRMCIQQLPQSLVIHLKRFEYDHMLNQRFKVRERFEFPSVLDMYPYTAEGLAAQDKAQQEQSADAMQSDANAAAPPPASDADSSPPPQHLYELRGVVVHSGSAFVGHYYSFIQERPHVKQVMGPDGTVQLEETQPGRWFNFDDRNVRPWDPANMEDQCFGGMPSQLSSDSSSGGGGIPDERAYSAFLLFYDRLDGSCVEVDPVPSFLPPTIAAAQAQAAVATSVAEPAGVAQGANVSETGAAAMAVSARPSTAGGSSSMGGEAAGPMQVSEGGRTPPGAEGEAATPYGLHDETYRGVLYGNMELLRRYRAFEREYAIFVRKVCELRITRKPVASRKVRRTRLLETGGDDALAGDGSSGGAGAVASAGAGGSGASGAVASPVPPQSAAVQRDADRLQAAEESVKLALEWVTSVLFNAPLAYQLSELEVWLPLMQKLLGCGASVACKAVQTLIVDRDRGNMLLDVLTSGFSFGNKHSLHFTARLLESVQMHLIAYSDQVVHAFIEQQQGANGANVFSHPTITLHKQFLEWVIRAISAHVNECNDTRLQMRRRGTNNGGQSRYNILDHALVHYGPFFKLLGTAIAHDAPAVYLLPRGFQLSQLLHQAIMYGSRVVMDEIRNGRGVYGQDELFEAVGVLGQVLVRLAHPVETLYQEAAQLPENDTRRAPFETLDSSLFSAGMAMAQHYPQRLADPLDPGPQFANKFEYDIDSMLDMVLYPVSQMHYHARRSVNWNNCALVNALVCLGTGALQNEAVCHVLQLLSWNNITLSEGILVTFLEEVHALDCDDTDADYAAYDCVQTAAQALFGFRDMYTDTRMDVLFGEGPAAHLRVPTVRDMLMEKRGDMWRMFQGWLVISGLFEINDLRHVLRRYVATYLRMGIVPGGPMGHLEDPNGFQKAVQSLLSLTPNMLREHWRAIELCLKPSPLQDNLKENIQAVFEQVEYWHRTAAAANRERLEQQRQQRQAAAAAPPQAPRHASAGGAVPPTPRASSAAGGADGRAAARSAPPAVAPPRAAADADDPVDSCDDYSIEDDIPSDDMDEGSEGPSDGDEGPGAPPVVAARVHVHVPAYRQAQAGNAPPPQAGSAGGAQAASASPNAEHGSSRGGEGRGGGAAQPAAAAPVAPAIAVVVAGTAPSPAKGADTNTPAAVDVPANSTSTV